MILIMMTSRSGSSLVASIFAAHGYAHGDCYSHQFDYKTFESADVKQLTWEMNEKGLHRRGQFCEYYPGAREIAATGISLIKVGVEYYRVFKPLEWHTVAVRRNPENIIKSVMEKNPGVLQEVRDLTYRRMAMLDHVVHDSGGANIDADQIMAGDFSGVRAAFDHFGLLFDEAAARRCVKPEKWHHK